jgi:hypothetical protein
MAGVSLLLRILLFMFGAEKRKVTKDMRGFLTTGAMKFTNRLKYQDYYNGQRILVSS